MKKVFCVISHTHWDREWYAPLEVFRTKLVDLFDRLLLILDEHPEYIFHMDAQTVVLEDYLQVRPEKKELLKQHVSNGRIVIGPWYLQSDFYLTSGESTVRNLLAGQEIAREYGHSGKIGYAPDQFGNISQLPQILKDFGIDNFVFGRGFSQYSPDENGKPVRHPSPTEFIWKGPDGTEVLAIHMRHWYNNAQRFSADLEKTEKYLRWLETLYDNEYTFTPYLLLMNGVDHLEAQGDVLEIIDGVQKRLKEGEYFLQYNFDDYVADVKRYIAEHDVKLPEYRGEFRWGVDEEILTGTLSSRHYLKVANVAAQNLLETKLEPLYTMLERQGMRGIYSRDHMRYMWKLMMRNHPHDSICGCSRDEVHHHMEHHYEELFEFGNEMLVRGMKEAAHHSAALRKASRDEYIITVANTLSAPVCQGVEVSIDFLKSDAVTGFDLLDDQGNPVEYQVFGRCEREIYVFNPVNLPGGVDVDTFTIRFETGEVAPYSFKTFILRKSDRVKAIEPVKCCDLTSMENEFLRVDVAADGTVTLTEKESGRVLKNCIKIEDRADAGESYMFFSAGDEPICSDTSDAFAKEVRVIEKNDFVKKIRIAYTMNLPADYDRANKKRTEETAVSSLFLDLTLKKGQRWMDVDYTIDNHSKGHRTRIVVDGDVKSPVSTADIPFDVVTHGEEAHFFGAQCKVLPNTSFAALAEEGRGVAVFTKGAHEYEHMKGSQLAFTILRATGKISLLNADHWNVPGNQCLRTISGSLAVMPFGGSIEEANLPAVSQRVRTPLLTYATSCDVKKFAGGRPAVQDSNLSEFFYLPDVFPQAAIPSNVPAVEVEGNVIVTALKQSENQSGYILRLCNFTEQPQKIRVRTGGKIYKTTMAEVGRAFLGLEEISRTMRPKEILTLYFA